MQQTMQAQQLRRMAERSAVAFLLAVLCVYPLYIDKFSNLGVVTLSWAFCLWLGALAAIGARPRAGRLPWRTDHGLWALGAVVATSVVSTVTSLSPAMSLWGLGGYYGGCMMVLFTAVGAGLCPAKTAQRPYVLRGHYHRAGHGAVCAQHF